VPAPYSDPNGYIQVHEDVEVRRSVARHVGARRLHWCSDPSPVADTCSVVSDPCAAAKQALGDYNFEASRVRNPFSWQYTAAVQAYSRQLADNPTCFTPKQLADGQAFIARNHG